MADVTSAATGALLVGSATTGSLVMGQAATGSISLGFHGLLASPPFQQRIRALTSTRLRLDFNKPVAVDAALKDPTNYTLSIPNASPVFDANGDPVLDANGNAVWVVGGTQFAVLPVILSVVWPEGATQTTYIELVTTEQTDLVVYGLTVAANALVDPSGVYVAANTRYFDGIGVRPQIQLALALSATEVLVQFTEPVWGVDLEDPSSYSFDNGLTVESVSELKTDSVVLTTSAQTAGTLYTLTIAAADIYDNARNPLALPATSPMLGFVSIAAVKATLSLSMYQFLIASIREADQLRGNRFVERFFEGPQEVWSETTDKILGTLNLWSAADAPEQVLPYLARFVGWTSGLEAIPDALDTPTLRELISSSAAFWKSRGNEESLSTLIQLTSAAPNKIVNWFGLRWISDLTHTGVEGTEDPWLLDQVGQREYNLRIVDDGSLDRSLVRGCARLTRPLGERVEILYLKALEEFSDLSQWDVSGAPAAAVSNGTLPLTDAAAEEVFYNADVLANDWSGYSVAWRAKQAGTGLYKFYRTGPGDYYVVEVQTAVGQVVLARYSAGSRAVLATIPTGAGIVADVNYTVRVEVVRENSTNRIRVYVDQTLLYNGTDDSHATGTIAMAHDAGSTITIDEVEVVPFPVESDYIDINT